MSNRPAQLLFAAILAVVGVLAWLPRSVEGLKHAYSQDGSEWFSRDPDGLYHARRVERALREGEVAERDPRMNFPEGAPIPWPPYYDLALSKALAPFAPDSPEQRWRWIERAVSSAPRLFGVLAALVAAWGAWRLAGATAALVAGIGVALCRGTVNYGVVGTGDHHAWVSLLAALSLLALSRALRADVLRSPARSALWGALLGVLCGLLIGSWVASLLYVIHLQLALGWMLVRRSREPLPGLPSLGLALHGVAALTLLPAVLSSPWRAEFPWTVVNLSWFHLVELALGALVFVPLALAGRGRLAAGEPLARLYPLLVAAALALLAGVSWALGLAPARGIAEGFEWVSRADAFMDTVQESMPLLGPRAEPGVLFFALGYTVLIVPIALGYGAWRVLRHGEDELAPWWIATAVLLPQALQQRRFADALAVPMAVVLGWGAARLVARGPRRLLAPLAVGLALAGQLPSARAAWRSLAAGRSPAVGGPTDVALGEREALEWIRARSNGDDAWSVLSHWDRGHTIEWASNAPSVATNFGSYIGLDSYRDPPSFFLSERPSAAREVLLRRRVRFVYAPAALVHLTASMCRVAAPERRDLYLQPNPKGGFALTERWYATMAARLLLGGTPIAPSGAPVGEETAPLAFLRLCHVTARRDTRFAEPMTGLPFPVGFVWEHVEGATVEAEGAPGEQLEVEFDLDFPGSRYRLPWRAAALADERGVARLRVAYATDVPNGDGRVSQARWRLGARSGALTIPESAVLAGGVVKLP